MNYIKDMMILIEKLANHLGINTDENFSYNDFVNSQLPDVSEVRLPFSLRTEVISFLVVNDITKKDEITEYLFKKNYSDYNSMSDTELVIFLGYILCSINFVQNENLLLLKYNIKTYNTGWFNLLKLCRGKVVDIKTKEIVTYPFDKFFNINEVEGYEFETINALTKTAAYVYVNDKIDGSTISVSKYNDKLLITTNGAFNNDMTVWATELLAEKYPDFEKEIKSGYTYIFELVHPENKIILDYGNEKALYLLNIRNIGTGKLLPIPEVRSFGKQIGFKLPQTFDFGSLRYLTTLAETSSNTNKEGWVLRIGQTDGSETMVKIKYEEYFALHRIKDHLRAKHVYDALLGGYLDDMLAVSSEETKIAMLEYARYIGNLQLQIEKEVIEIGCSYLKKYNVSHRNISNEILIPMVHEILASNYKWKNFVVDYVKHPEFLTEKILRLRRGRLKDELREIDRNIGR